MHDGFISGGSKSEICSTASYDQTMYETTSLPSHYVLDDADLPFEEDHWKYVKIGETIFRVAKPCKRCAFVTVNPLSGRHHSDTEPLKTLRTFR